MSTRPETVRVTTGNQGPATDTAVSTAMDRIPAMRDTDSSKARRPLLPVVRRAEHATQRPVRGVELRTPRRIRTTRPDGISSAEAAETPAVEPRSTRMRAASGSTLRTAILRQISRVKEARKLPDSRMQFSQGSLRHNGDWLQRFRIRTRNRAITEPHAKDRLTPSPDAGRVPANRAGGRA